MECLVSINGNHRGVRKHSFRVFCALRPLLFHRLQYCCKLHLGFICVTVNKRAEPHRLIADTYATLPLFICESRIPTEFTTHERSGYWRGRRAVPLGGMASADVSDRSQRLPRGEFVRLKSTTRYRRMQLGYSVLLNE